MGLYLSKSLKPRCVSIQWSNLRPSLTPHDIKLALSKNQTIMCDSKLTCLMSRCFVAANWQYYDNNCRVYLCRSVCKNANSCLFWSLIFLLQQQHIRYYCLLLLRFWNVFASVIQTLNSKERNVEKFLTFYITFSK